MAWKYEKVNGYNIIGFSLNLRITDASTSSNVDHDSIKLHTLVPAYSIIKNLYGQFTKPNSSKQLNGASPIWSSQEILPTQ